MGTENQNNTVIFSVYESDRKKKCADDFIQEVTASMESRTMKTAMMIGIDENDKWFSVVYTFQDIPEVAYAGLAHAILVESHLQTKRENGEI